MAVQILAGSMACVCHTVIADLKVANVCGFLQCVTLSSYVQQCLICKIVVVTSHFVRWRQRPSCVSCARHSLGSVVLRLYFILAGQPGVARAFALRAEVCRFAPQAPLSFLASDHSIQR